MGLFAAAQREAIDKIAQQSQQLSESRPSTKSKGLNEELEQISKQVLEYFSDSPAILITGIEELHEYIDEAIKSGYCGIDTETTGLDRVHDRIVGASLYYPGGTECYIPIRHLVPIFDTLRKGQLTEEVVGQEFQRFVDAGTKMIFANADFDLAMMYKDLDVDMNDVCYYDVILAWRCLKEDEKQNGLKFLWNKYVNRGQGDPMKFSDFFSPSVFPYCRPEIAKLYAANDAKITYELFKWQLPYVTKTHPKCQKAHLEAIADLVWNVEFPLIKICQNMHRRGMYIDNTIVPTLLNRYHEAEKSERQKLADMVDEILADTPYTYNSKQPFTCGADFNPKSPPHVKYLLYDLLKISTDKSSQGTGKEVLNELNLPIAKQILKVRSLNVLISTFVEKMPKATTSDGRIHACFKQIGAATGRFSSESPNIQNIPSHALDIRHMFRATTQHTELLDCVESNDSICVSVSSTNTITTPDGDRYIKDLEVGDKVMLLEDGKEIWKVVKSISTSYKDVTLCDVVF